MLFSTAVASERAGRFAQKKENRSDNARPPPAARSPLPPNARGRDVS